MVQASIVLVEGNRPPLGVLVFDTGAAVSLSSDLVIGRDPSDHELVRAGQAEPIIFEDPSRTVSRAHLGVRLRDWDVYLMDLGAANRTFLLEHDGRDIRALAPAEEVKLDPGARFRIGERRGVFESPLSRT
jgi:pSer/pThr/pTyr-binding forkhead associated (FHA) protein